MVGCAATLGLNDLYVVFDDAGVNLDYFMFSLTEAEIEITPPDDTVARPYSIGSDSREADTVRLTVGVVVGA